MTNKRKFLFITSYFPPLGGPGVQRQLYYVHYSEEFGWQPFVLTSKEVLYHVYDHTLLEKLPSNTKIIRTESLEFGRVLFQLQRIKKIFCHHKAIRQAKDDEKVSPRMMYIGRFLRDWFTIIDDRVFWIPFALPAAVKAINENNIDVVVARGGPYSNTLLGMCVSKITQKPLVLDLADPWLDYPYINFPTRLHKKIISYFEHKVFLYAAKLSVASPVIKARIVERYPKIDPENIQVITNGFDSGEFLLSTNEIKPNKKFTIAHVGTLSWIRYEAFHSLCVCIYELIKSHPEFSKMVNLELVGDVNTECGTLVRNLNLESIVTYRGYLAHSEAVKAMMMADLLFMPIDSEISNKDGCYVVPGKLYDYIGSNTPILMIGPKNCDASNIVIDNNFGAVFEPNQREEIKAFLTVIIKKRKVSSSTKSSSNSQKYERRHLAKEFFEILDSVMDDERKGSDVTLASVMAAGK
jgi:glycosyltransferase involved in cell wall biosynthesis